MAAPAKKGKHASAPRTAAATSAAAGAEAGLPVLSAGRLSALRAFSLAAAALSAYLAFLSLTQGVALGCGPESSCERVLSSRWAYWLGLPVSLFAVSVDGLLFGWSFHVGPGWPVERRRLAWTWLISLAVLVSGAALWFVGLQLFVMHWICPYCMAAHASGAIAAGLIFSAAPRGTSGASAAGGLATLLSRLPRLKVGLLLAFAGLAFLIAGQLLHQPKTFAEHPLPSGHAVSNQASDGSGRPGMPASRDRSRP